MRILVCSDMGLDCSYIEQGDTDEKVISQYINHLRNTHFDLARKLEDYYKIKAKIRNG